MVIDTSAFLWDRTLHWNVSSFYPKSGTGIGTLPGKSPESLRVPGVSTAAPSSAPALRVPRLARCGSARPSGWLEPPARRPFWPRRARAGASRAGHTAPAPRGGGRRRHGRGPSWSARAPGAGPPGVRAAAPGAGGGSVAGARRPITPFMYRYFRPRPILYYIRTSTNLP